MVNCYLCLASVQSAQDVVQNDSALPNRFLDFLEISVTKSTADKVDLCIKCSRELRIVDRFGRRIRNGRRCRRAKNTEGPKYEAQARPNLPPPRPAAIMPPPNRNVQVEAHPIASTSAAAAVGSHGQLICAEGIRMGPAAIEELKQILTAHDNAAIDAHNASKYPKVARVITPEGIVVGELIEVEKTGRSSRLRIACNGCSEKSLSERNFKCHLQEHNPEESANSAPVDPSDRITYVCMECKELYHTQASARKHFKTAHSIKRAYKCDKCPSSFGYKNNLRYHVIKHGYNGTHECPDCHRIFPTRDDLKTHMRTHAPNKPFMCEICFASFKREVSYIRHEGRHYPSNLQCRRCELVFGTRAEFRTHQENCFAPEREKPDGDGDINTSTDSQMEEESETSDEEPPKKTDKAAGGQSAALASVELPKKTDQAQGQSTDNASVELPKATDQAAGQGTDNASVELEKTEEGAGDQGTDAAVELKKTEEVAGPSTGSASVKPKKKEEAAGQGTKNASVEPKKKQEAAGPSTDKASVEPKKTEEAAGPGTDNATVELPQKTAEVAGQGTGHPSVELPKKTNVAAGQSTEHAPVEPDVVTGQSTDNAPVEPSTSKADGSSNVQSATAKPQTTFEGALASDPLGDTKPCTSRSQLKRVKRGDSLEDGPPDAKTLVTEVVTLPKLRITNLHSVRPNVEILPPAPVPSTSSGAAAQPEASPINKHQCTQCQKYFNDESALSKHMRTHAGEKPHKCNFCSKSFTDPWDLKKHKMIHTKTGSELNILGPSTSVRALSSPALSCASETDSDATETHRSTPTIETSDTSNSASMSALSSASSFSSMATSSPSDEANKTIWQSTILPSVPSSDGKGSVRISLTAVSERKPEEHKYVDLGVDEGEDTVEDDDEDDEEEDEEEEEEDEEDDDDDADDEKKDASYVGDEDDEDDD